MAHLTPWPERIGPSCPRLQRLHQNRLRTSHQLIQENEHPKHRSSDRDCGSAEITHHNPILDRRALWRFPPFTGPEIPRRGMRFGRQRNHRQPALGRVSGREDAISSPQSSDGGAGEGLQDTVRSFDLERAVGGLDTLGREGVDGSASRRHESKQATSRHAIIRSQRAGPSHLEGKTENLHFRHPARRGRGGDEDGRAGSLARSWSGSGQPICASRSDMWTAEVLNAAARDDG